MKHLKFYESFGQQDERFSAWFGKSVLCQKNGEPVVVYHGTDAEPFDAFDAAHTTHNVSKFGFWFADDQDFCTMFGGRAMPVYLRLENPYLISADRWNSIRSKHAKNVGWFEAWREDLKAKGHDGLIVKDSMEQFGKMQVRNPKIIAVFSPLQIKSVDNNGSFDPTDSNIYR